MNNRKHIIKITHPRRNMLGMDDDINIINLLNSFTPIDPVKPKIIYGYLYDNMVVNDSRNIASEGWRVPDNSDWSKLINYITNKYHYIYLHNLSKYLKSKNIINSEYGWGYDLDIHPRWNENNEHAGVDKFGFNSLPGGMMKNGFNFLEMGEFAHYWSSSKTTERPHRNYGVYHKYDNSRFYFNILYNLNDALNIRLVKTLLLENEKKLKEYTILKNIYTGNDEKKYDGVKIGDQIWLAENLAETKYRNGDEIEYFFNENQPFLYGDHNVTGGIIIENNNKLKINRNNINDDGVVAWLNNINVDDYCRVHKKNSFNVFWFGKRKKLNGLQSLGDYLEYDFEFIDKSGDFSVGDEVVLSYYKKINGFRYSYNNKDFFSIYPTNTINLYDNTSPLKLNDMNEMEYAIRVKEAIKKHVSLPNIRTVLINTRNY